MVSKGDTVAITAHCLCKANSFSVHVPLSKVPLSASACHCDSCRHVTGALYSIAAPWPEPRGNVNTSKLKKYAFSPRINILFCAACSTPLFFEDAEEPHDLDVFTGTLENTEGDIVKLKNHIFVGDTVDGGATMWMRKPNADGTEAKRYKMRKTCEEDEGIPYDWPLPSSLTGYEKAVGDMVPVWCHCKGVQLVLHRASYIGKSREELPWFVDPKTHKSLASFCSCHSCRLFTGVDVHNWGFAQLKELSFATNSNAKNKPFPKTTFELRQAVDEQDAAVGTLTYYASSPDVQRYFCSRCSASIFYAADDRPDIVDIGLGVLQASDGARAEGFFSWSFGKLGIAENARDGWRESMIRSVAKESEEWRRSRGYPKDWRQSEQDTAAASK